MWCWVHEMLFVIVTAVRRSSQPATSSQLAYNSRVLSAPMQADVENHTNKSLASNGDLMTIIDGNRMTGSVIQKVHITPSR